MGEHVPLAMFVSRRALCPGCGAPLQLEGAQAQVKCAFCGGMAVVERRLRESEADVPTEQKKIQIDWTPSHLAEGTAEERASCPGCGGGLVFPATQGVVTCATCGTASKVERRMRLLDLDIPVEKGEDRHTVALLEQIKNSTDLAEQVTLAENFSHWGSINRTLARHVSELMEIMQTSDPKLAHALGDAIGKLLCQGDVLLQDSVVYAAPKFIFDENGSKALLWELGLGKGVCLKPILDAADVLGRKGAIVMSCMALWAANTLLGRNYPEHPVLSKVILYRLLYLSGPVLSWALDVVAGRGVVKFKYSTEMLLQFIDDCAAERPRLVPEIRDGIVRAEAEDEAAYRSRLDLMGRLQTAEAREALLHSLPAPPEGTSLRLLTKSIDTLVAALDDPALTAPATGALVRTLQRTGPAPFHKLVQKRGDDLPEDLRRAYLKAVPDSPHLSKLPAKYRKSEKKRERDPEFVEAKRLFDEGLTAAIATFNRERNELRKFRAIIKDRTPLMAAASQGDTEQVVQMIASGLEVDETNAFGRTALMFAAQAGHAATVKEMVARGADPGRHDKDGMSAFSLAAAAGHSDLVRAMMTDMKIPAALRQEGFRAALHSRQLAVMKVLLENGADPDVLGDDGGTPLIAAAGAGDAGLVEVLLDGEAVIDHQDNKGRSAILAASESGRGDVVRLLLKRGADPNLQDARGDTPLILSARGGHADVAKALAKGGADPGAVGRDGLSPLALARKKKDAGVAGVLEGLKSDLPVDPKALFEAVDRDEFEAARDMLERGGDPNAREGKGNTILIEAMRGGNEEMTRLILDHNPDVNLPGHWERTPLIQAVHFGKPEIVRILLDRGADVNATDKSGNTALMAAAWRRDTDILQMLIHAGANIHARNQGGHTALASAKSRPSPEAIRVLEEAGAEE